MQSTEQVNAEYSGVIKGGVLADDVVVVQVCKVCCQEWVRPIIYICTKEDYKRFWKLVELSGMSLSGCSGTF